MLSVPMPCQVRPAGRSDLEAGGRPGIWSCRRDSAPVVRAVAGSASLGMAPLKPHRPHPSRLPASPQVVGVAPHTEIGRRCSTHYLPGRRGHGTDVSVAARRLISCAPGPCQAARSPHRSRTWARERPDVTLAPAVPSDSRAISATAPYNRVAVTSFRSDASYHPAGWSEGWAHVSRHGPRSRRLGVPAARVAYGA
jgi:hypothetical protein